MSQHASELDGDVGGKFVIDMTESNGLVTKLNGLIEVNDHFLTYLYILVTPLSERNLRHVRLHRFVVVADHPDRWVPIGHLLHYLDKRHRISEILLINQKDHPEITAQLDQHDLHEGHRSIVLRNH